MCKQSEWMKGLLAAEGLVCRDGFEQTRKSFDELYYMDTWLTTNDCELSDTVKYYNGFSDYLSNYKERNDA
jgi:hypothetical protein